MHTKLINTKIEFANKNIQSNSTIEPQNILNNRRATRNRTKLHTPAPKAETKR